MLNKNWICWILIGSAALSLFFSSIFFDFTYDDFWQIHRNELVTGDSAWPEIFWTATPPGNLYRPLSTLSYALTYRFFGENPLPYHLFNLLLYAITACLVFELCRPILGSAKVALVASLAFVVHPLHVEAVCNVVGRAEILSAFFGILCCLSLLKRPILAALMLLAATLCKESAFAFVILAPLYLHYREALSLPFMLKKSLPLIIACIFSVALRINALGSNVLAHEGQLGIVPENPIAHLNFVERLLPALKVQGEYVRLFFSPIKLSADYSLMPQDFLAGVYSIEGILLIALFVYLGMAIYYFRKDPWSYFGWWYLITILPSANIISPIGTIMGDRLAFAPSVGLIVWFVALLAKQSRLPRLRIIAHPLSAGLALALFALHSSLRIPIWRNNFMLFGATVNHAPRSPKAAFNFAVELHKRGDLEVALLYFRRTLELNPNHLVAAGNLADIFLKQRQFARVEYWYRYILERDPSNAKVKDALEKLLALKKPKTSQPGYSAAPADARGARDYL